MNVEAVKAEIRKKHAMISELTVDIAKLDAAIEECKASKRASEKTISNELEAIRKLDVIVAKDLTVKFLANVKFPVKRIYLEYMCPPRAVLVYMENATIKETESGFQYLAFKGKKRSITKFGETWKWDQTSQDGLGFLLWSSCPLFDSFEIDNFDLTNEAFIAKAEDMLQERLLRKGTL